MTTLDIMRAGGQRLRQLREAKEMTQQDVERATRDRFGSDSRVYAQQVSRIEKGQVDKPPILDLLRVGQVLGLTPEDIAETFELWPVQRDGPQLGPRLREAVDLAERLPFDLKEKLLTQVEFATALVKADARARAQQREKDPPVEEKEVHATSKPRRHTAH